jgi:hypothetical protein
MAKGRLVATGKIGKGKRGHIFKSPNVAYCGRSAVFHSTRYSSLKGKTICINCRMAFK